MKWGQISALLLNNVISSKFFIFFQKNDFSEVLNKNELIFGAKYKLITSIFLGVNKKCIINFLSFLKIDYVTSKKLAVLTLKSNNFEGLLSLLKNDERVLVLPSNKFNKFDFSQILKKCNKYILQFLVYVTILSLCFWFIIYNLFSIFFFIFHACAKHKHACCWDGVSPSQKKHKHARLILCAAKLRILLAQPCF